MRQGKLVFAQLSEHLPRSVFLSFAARYAGRYPIGGMPFCICDE